MKFVSSLVLSLLISPACLANPSVYTTSEGKSSPIPDGVLDSTTHCGLNLEVCSKNKENGFCRDIVDFAKTRSHMDYAALHRQASQKIAAMANPGKMKQETPKEAEEKKKHTELIASLAEKKKKYIQGFVAAGLTRSQINNIPFPPEINDNFYNTEGFRCKNVSEPSTPLYTANDGNASPIPDGVLDSTKNCGLNLEVCWVEGVSLWKTHNPFCRDIKKLAGLKNEIEEKGKIASLTSQQQNYIDALEAIGLTQEQIQNIPPYNFIDQGRENMDQSFYCRNNIPILNKPTKKTFKEKVTGFFKGNKGGK